VKIGEVDFVLADIPGLIEGANEGAGIGTKFLGHVERCRVLLHLVDATQDDVATDYRTVREELDAYGAGLETKSEIIALSKVDALDEDTIAERAKDLKAATGVDPLIISAVSGRGVNEALYALARKIQAASATDAEAEKEPEPWSP
jgi:GTPase